MNFRGSRVFLAVSGTVTVASFLASCSLLPQSQVNQSQDSQAPEGIALRKVAQLGFGREAVFGACIEPACPNVTRKTLVTAQAIATASEFVAVEPIIEKVAPKPTATKQLLQREIADYNEVASEAPRPALILHFPLARTELTASDKAALDKVIPSARKAKRIVIASRTDNVGSDSANQATALVRAQTVRDYLRAKLPERGDALVIDAQASCCFIASNDTLEGRKQNRRVEIVLSVPEQVAP